MALFSHDGKFMRFMERFADVLWLNILWVAFCLPIVTIGAATVAAYCVTLKMIDDEEGPIARSFLKAFKENFPKGTVLWILNAIALYALYLDWQIVLKSPDPSVWLIIASILSSAFIFCAFVYAYPQAARYENKLRNILLNSLRISFRYRGRTLILIIVILLEIGLFIWNVPMLIVGALAGPMILLYTVSGIAKRIFQDIDRAESKRNGDEAGV